MNEYGRVDGAIDATPAAQVSANSSVVEPVKAMHNENTYNTRNRSLADAAFAVRSTLPDPGEYTHCTWSLRSTTIALAKELPVRLAIISLGRTNKRLK